MECPICLDDMGPAAVVGTVHGCRHSYHDTCIILWSKHSNSCPTCRKLFYRVDIAPRDAPGSVLHRVTVQDKLMPNDAIDQIPQEYINAEEPAMEVPNGVCTVCSSADYSVRSRLVCCIACGANFHNACLSHSGDSWFCPVCDCHQERVSEMRRAGPSRVSRARVPRVPRPAPEIEEFDEPIRIQPSVLNGGVLLRREARAARNLTPAEAQSWEMFEQARRGDEMEVPHLEVATATRKRRRRRHLPEEGGSGAVASETASQALAPPPQTVLLPTESSLVQSSSQSSPVQSDFTGEAKHLTSASTKPSRIASLMSQIKSHPSRPVHYRETQAASPASQSSPISVDSDSSSETETKRPYPDLALTLDQKRVVQRHVRNYLRPLYQKTDASGPAINSEVEYININKSISRKIYSVILALCADNGPEVMDDFFADDSVQLRDLVDSCVQEQFLRN